MALSDPLRPIHEENQASFIPYGPTESDQAIQIVDTFGPYEAEYAAIRKGVGLMSLPQRGLVEVTGGDRLDFLNRLLTNEMASLSSGEGRRAFLLVKTGRIRADATVLHEPNRTCLEVDLFQAGQLAIDLEKYVFTEDVTIRDISDQYCQLALKGPLAGEVLAEAGLEGIAQLQSLDHRQTTLAGHPCVVFRMDDTGTPGFHLIVPCTAVADVYQSFKQAIDTPARRGRCKPVGWLAMNTARIEAGTPIYHVDFGPDTLPHETGILDQTVNFSKGCYLGQEVVARMQNLGHPKRVLVGLRFNDDRLPIAGTQVMEPAPRTDPTTSQEPETVLESVQTSGVVIGAITSSCVSPMLGGKAIAFAMVRWDMHELGTRVVVPAEGQMVQAKVVPLASLRGPSRGN